MEKNNFDIRNLIKLFVDSIGQDSFKDFYGSNWEARKKELQKLQKTEIQQKEYSRFLDLFSKTCHISYYGNFEKNRFLLL